MTKEQFSFFFEKVRLITGLDYAITDIDEYGDNISSVYDKIIQEFGKDADGLFLKHWESGENSTKWEPPFYVEHCLKEETLEERGDAINRILKTFFTLRFKNFSSSLCFVVEGLNPDIKRKLELARIAWSYDPYEFRNNYSGLCDFVYEEMKGSIEEAKSRLIDFIIEAEQGLPDDEILRIIEKV